jgi:hypothetical protein
MAFSIRDQIKREHILRQSRQPDKTYRKVSGSQYAATSSGEKIIYCPICKGPMVDSDHGRRAHAQRSPRCRDAVLA